MTTSRMYLTQHRPVGRTLSGGLGLQTGRSYRKFVVLAEYSPNSRRRGGTAKATMVDVLGPGAHKSILSMSEPSSQPSYEHHMNNWNVGWFSRAVEDIVRRLDGTEASDQFVHVVTNHMNADAVILVKKIVTKYDLKTHHIVEGRSMNPGMQPPDRRDVEHACDQVIKSHGRMLVNAGRVGECCDTRDTYDIDGEKTADQIATAQHQGSGKPNRKAAFHGYWGVVVQTKDRSSVEGCYLLKAGCSVVEGGCSCTHYSMTKVEEPGQPVPAPGMGADDVTPSIHQQFIDSWRVPYL